MRTSFRDVDWALADEKGNIQTWEKVGVAVLMDIRYELKCVNAELRMLNGLLRRPNFLSIPNRLERIARNTAKPKRKRKPKAE